jgi:hypothetical protein
VPDIELDATQEFSPDDAPTENSGRAMISLSGGGGVWAESDAASARLPARILSIKVIFISV